MTDPYTQAAAEMFNVPVDQVTKDMRREAKALNFGAAYALPPPKVQEQCTNMVYSAAFWAAVRGRMGR